MLAYCFFFLDTSDGASFLAYGVPWGLFIGALSYFFRSLKWISWDFCSKETSDSLITSEISGMGGWTLTSELRSGSTLDPSFTLSEELFDSSCCYS